MPAFLFCLLLYLYIFIFVLVSKSFDYLLVMEIVSYEKYALTGIVHFEINFWYVLAYLKGIQDVSLFSQ